MKAAISVSEKPWSEYTKADYSIEQWHAACLIHLHNGPPTSKGQCKLPVKTPSGTVNRNGVHAAAAALAGARGGVMASSEQKASAARAIRGLYAKLGEEVPNSIKQTNVDVGKEFLEHYGVLGMQWGVRNDRRLRREAKRKVKRAGKRAEAEGIKKAKERKETRKKTRPKGPASPTARTKYQKPPAQLNDVELNRRIKRMELEKKYNDLNAEPKTAGRKFASETVNSSGKTVIGTVVGTTTGFMVKRALNKKFGPNQ